MFKYSLLLMSCVFILNLKSDGHLPAGIFIIIYLLWEYFLSNSKLVETYMIYAAGELLYIHWLYSIDKRIRLISDMINLSRLSICIQLIGAVMWIQYYTSEIYLVLCEMVFIMQIIRLGWHGVATRKAANHFSDSRDTLYFSYSGEKL